MPISLENNSYRILGLDTSATERDILKRSKEIVNRLKVDDVPSYDLDIGSMEKFRSEASVRDALQRLQAPKKQIKEYFFWFQIADSVDEQVLGLFKLKDHLNAIRYWQKASIGQGTKAFFYKKNLAILYCLALAAEDNKDYLHSSLIAWKELTDSSKFWASFTKVYKLHYEQTASGEIIADFRKKIVGYLSDMYTELYQLHNNTDYVNEFQSVFSAKGEKIEKNVFGPAFQAINQAVEGLEKMTVSKDNKLDQEESDTIRSQVAIIQVELNKLMDLGLYDDSQTKIMRDRAATALRSISVDIHNNLNEFEKSLKLLDVAMMLVGTESLKNKLKADHAEILKNKKQDEENSLAIELPGHGDKTILFKNNYLYYDNTKIYYNDVNGISYHSTHHTTSVYGVPVSNSYSYHILIKTPTNSVSLTFSARKEVSEKKDVWVKLVGLISNLIEPVMVKKLVDTIFERSEPVTIGGVEFSKKGYSKNKVKLFRKGEKITIKWTDKIYVPKYNAGMVILWIDKNGSGQQFTTISMASPNAVLIPELVQACINRAQ